MTSNAVPPSVTPPSPNEWPQNTVIAITGITNDSQALVTAPAHGMTSANNGNTFVGFKQVQGMIQINGTNALITTIIDANNFRVSLNTTNFYVYASNGVVIVDTSIDPIQQQGSQTFNRPFQNIANTL